MAEAQARAQHKEPQHEEQCAPSEAWARVKSRLRGELGEDVYASWFRGIELDEVSGGTVHLTVATRFLRNWLRTHYYDSVLRQVQGEWPGAERVEFTVRQPLFSVEPAKEMPCARQAPVTTTADRVPLPMPLRTGYEGFEGEVVGFLGDVHEDDRAGAAAGLVRGAFGRDLFRCGAGPGE